MRKKQDARFIASSRRVACSLALTIFGLLLGAAPAEAQPVRVRLTIDLDPALAMGERVTTVVPVRRVGPQKRYVAAGPSLPREIGAALWRRPYFYWSDGTYDGPTILGEAMKIENAPIIAPIRPSPPSVEAELAAALKAGRYREAVDALRPIAEPPDPVNETAPELLNRYLVALEGAGRTGEAARLLVRRLERASDGDLAGLMAIDRGALLSSAAETRRLQRLAADYLARTEDPRGGVLLASYLWTDARFASVRTLLDEAREAGLSRELHARLTSALTAAAP